MFFARHTLTALACLAAFQAQATNLITNGGFETADFTGWSTSKRPQSFGNLTVESGYFGPASGHVNSGPSAGQYFALSDQTGVGTYALMQAFTVAEGTTSVMFNFDLFANNSWGTFIDPIGLEHIGNPNQHVRVDLLAGSADAFDTGDGVLGNFYLGTDAGANPNPWTSYSFDVTALAKPGGAYQIRFAEVDNQFFLNMGVDQVSINVTAIPEPGTHALMLIGLVGGGLITRARRR